MCLDTHLGTSLRQNRRNISKMARPYRTSDMQENAYSLGVLKTNMAMYTDYSLPSWHSTKQEADLQIAWVWLRSVRIPMRARRIRNLSWERPQKDGSGRWNAGLQRGPFQSRWQKRIRRVCQNGGPFSQPKSTFPLGSSRSWCRLAPIPSQRIRPYVRRQVPTADVSRQEVSWLPADENLLASAKSHAGQVCRGDRGCKCFLSWNSRNGTNTVGLDAFSPDGEVLEGKSCCDPRNHRLGTRKYRVVSWYELQLIKAIRPWMMCHHMKES